MGHFFEGVWHPGSIKSDSEGRFARRPTSFRNWMKSGDARPGRYHLYVSLACPWAHRTLIGRKLLGLEDAVGVSVVHWLDGPDGWFFQADLPDHVHAAKTLGELYLLADPKYTGSVTVPVMWDKEEKTIHNNESREILRQLSTQFGSQVDLCPDPSQVDEVLDQIYEPINNGVYRAGFATSQGAYDEAVKDLFAALDHWDGVLAGRPFLLGQHVTEADICLFTTLFRFDPVYTVLFQCCYRRIRDYANLWPYLRSIYQLPGVAETCSLEHIRNHYYQSLRNVNPSGIVAMLPEQNLLEPHGRYTHDPIRKKEAR